ncbi:Uu.00g143300.m01.CDS01 [Anthostomella pinea]|uniref:Uu.00g143300.m01.CDS01 n=1 Tax=Anthostomella pinea TaxID=933095 RepID=A0AAI8YLP2_9PEZI|nr:Uu.00g143300.m01.CDS01 [Anthostomella pinea]
MSTPINPPPSRPPTARPVSTRPPTARPVSTRPPTAFAPAPTPMTTPAPLPLPPPRQILGKTQLENALEEYMHPLSGQRPEGIMQYLANLFGPPPAPRSAAFVQYMDRKMALWRPFVRFVAERQMQDASEVPKLVAIIDLLVFHGVVDAKFVTQCLLEAYHIYIERHDRICVNRLYGFGLILQSHPRGLMHQVEFPGLMGEPMGIRVVPVAM